MTDLTGTLKNEIFRPLTGIVIPGLTALSPFLLNIVLTVPGAFAFWKSAPEVSAILVSAAVVAAGLTLEDIGSTIESTLWDKRISRKHPIADAEWHRYLGCTIKDDIVGERYLRTVVLRLKFELSMAPALIAFHFGFQALNWNVQVFDTRAIVAEIVTVIVLTGYLTHESYSSCRLLVRIRRDILARVP